MSDKLKQFIEQNRDDFDDAQPNPHLFRAIKEEMSGKKETGKTVILSMRRVAAGVAVLLALSMAIYFLFDNKKSPESSGINKDQQNEESLSKLAGPAYAKQINQFEELIGLQQTELEFLKSDHPQLYQQFINDINELDSSYQSLKIKLATNPNRELLLEAMIQNLQLQSELLNRQLLIIKEIKQKNKNHEKNTV